MKMIQARGGLDVYVAAVCPMDERTGYFRTFLFNVNETDFRNSAKKIFLEVVPSLPVIYGNNEIHVSEADGIYEYDHPLETMDPLPFGEVEKQIGSYVAELVEDGSTIQLGIGAIPVSYTHLDVYKRQPSSFPWQCPHCPPAAVLRFPGSLRLQHGPWRGSDGQNKQSCC